MPFYAAHLVHEEHLLLNQNSERLTKNEVRREKIKRVA